MSILAQVQAMNSPEAATAAIWPAPPTAAILQQHRTACHMQVRLQVQQETTTATAGSTQQGSMLTGSRHDRLAAAKRSGC